MLTVSITHRIQLDHQYRTRYEYDTDAHKSIDTDNVEDSENDQEGNDTSPEIPDILGFQPFELNTFIDALIDLINTVSHFDLFYNRIRLLRLLV